MTSKPSTSSSQDGCIHISSKRWSYLMFTYCRPCSISQRRHPSRVNARTHALSLSLSAPATQSESSSSSESAFRVFPKMVFRLICVALGVPKEMMPVRWRVTCKSLKKCLHVTYHSTRASSPALKFQSCPSRPAPQIQRFCSGPCEQR